MILRHLLQLLAQAVGGELGFERRGLAERGSQHFGVGDAHRHRGIGCLRQRYAAVQGQQVRQRVQPGLRSGGVGETGKLQRLAGRDREHLGLRPGPFQRVPGHGDKRGERGRVEPLRGDVIRYPAAPTGRAVALRHGALPLLLLVRVRKRLDGMGACAA